MHFHHIYPILATPQIYSCVPFSVFIYQLQFFLPMDVWLSNGIWKHSKNDKFTLHLVDIKCYYLSSAIRGDSHPTPFSILGFDLAWIFTRCVNAVTIAGISRAHLPEYICRTLFLCTLSNPLSFILFLPIIPQWSLRLGRSTQMSIWWMNIQWFIILCTLTSSDSQG